jgi:hypothetical protein
MVADWFPSFVSAYLHFFIFFLCNAVKYLLLVVPNVCPWSASIAKRYLHFTTAFFVLVFLDEATRSIASPCK